MCLLQTDISGAYTNVHHKRLIIAIFELIDRSTLPDDEKPWFLVVFTEKWLSDRVILFRGTHILMKKGVPQGDGYSPIAFVVYLAYQCKDKDCAGFYYADDYNLVIRAPTAEKLMEKSKVVFKEFENWCATRNMKADPKKTKFMMLFRTTATLNKVKHRFPAILSENFVQKMRVLGVMFDAMLNFVGHVANICNRIRTRINLLRKLKKVGLDVKNALQYVACVRASFHFGLYWTTIISENSWNKLERCWNSLLRTAIHERAPKSTKLDLIREITGHTTIKTFCYYLIHLRTSKWADSTKIDRFTLNHEEFLEMGNWQSLQNHRSFVEIRSEISERVDKTRQKRALEKLRLKFGPIKTATYQFGAENGWTEVDFRRLKGELRKIYNVKSKVPEKYLKMSKIAIFWVLVLNSHSYNNMFFDPP